MAKAATAKLLLVRSGSTEWDDAGRMQGATDLPLSPSGREAARAAVEDLSLKALGSVCCGPDEASVETGEMLVATTGSKLRRLDELCEIDLGLWEGLLGSDLEDRYPRAGGQWLDDPASVNAPEGEGLAEVSARLIGSIVKSLERAKAGSVTAVVLRPIALGVVRCWLNDRPTTELWSLLKDRPVAELYAVPREKLKTPLLPSSTA